MSETGSVIIQVPIRDEAIFASRIRHSTSHVICEIQGYVAVPDMRILDVLLKRIKAILAGKTSTNYHGGQLDEIQLFEIFAQMNF